MASATPTTLPRRKPLIADRSWRRRQLPTVLSWVLGIVLFVIVTIRSPGYGSNANITSIIEQAGIVGIAGIGQTFVILTGGIDLSIPGMMSIAGVFLARDASTNSQLWRPLLIVLAIAVAVGLVNGIIVGIFRAPAIIATLGMGGVLTGWLDITVQGGTGRSSGVIPSAIHDAAVKHVVGPIPELGVIWLILAIVVTLVLSRTAYGRRIYSVGNNAVAARIAGVNIPLTLISIYVLSAVTAAISGLLLSGYLNQAYPDMGTPYLFTSIAAVLIGGASILGGSGNYLGTIAGAFILTILNGLLAILNLGQNWVQILYGGVIFITVLASTVLSGQSGGPRVLSSLLRRRSPQAPVRPDPAPPDPE